jgi:Arc/MetJ family transcription regulator
MRTNIEIDDQLMTEVMKITGAKTKREAVDAALKRTLRAARQLEALEALRGIGWEGDLDEMRTDRPLPQWD